MNNIVVQKETGADRPEKNSQEHPETEQQPRFHSVGKLAVSIGLSSKSNGPSSLDGFRSWPWASLPLKLPQFDGPSEKGQSKSTDQLHFQRATLLIIHRGSEGWIVSRFPTLPTKGATARPAASPSLSVFRARGKSARSRSEGGRRQRRRRGRGLSQKCREGVACSPTKDGLPPRLTREFGDNDLHGHPIEQAVHEMRRSLPSNRRPLPASFTTFQL